MDLTAQNVEDLFRECLAHDGVEVDGVIGKAMLKVDGREVHIRSMLASLPSEFRSSGGGGWSFLNACLRGDGTQWTGLHQTMDRLFMLGIAAGLVHWLMPRDMWPTLPGGMPYVVIEI